MKQRLNLISVLLVKFSPLKAGWLLVLFIAFSFPVFSDNRQLAKEAVADYDKGKYEEAVKKYEQIIASGETSYELYFNIANAYYKSNKLGKAIYYYELAHKLNPADENVKHNLTIANKFTKDQIEQKENYFAKNVEAGILNFLTTTGWAWLSIIGLALACLCFSLFRITQKNGMRRFLFWIGILALVKCVAALIIGFMALNNIEEKTQAVIISAEVNVMNAPTGDAKTQFTLHEGTKAHVLESNAQWTSISLDNGNEGWVPTKDIGLF